MFVNFGDPIPSAAHPGALEAISSLGPHTRKLAHDVEKVRPLCSLTFPPPNECV